ncbi:MAG: ABC transporter substrate-binding protein [Candidatus Acidiferrales bacterium]
MLRSVNAWRATSWWLAAFFVLAACAAPLARSNDVQTIRLICLPNAPLAVVIGNMNGIFARYGIEVQAKKAADAAALRSALADGSADVAHAAVENAVTMVDSAQADVVIVIGGESSTSELIVQPEIKSVKDLRGHIIITDGPDTAYTLTLKQILLRNGLQPDKDCEFKVVGLAPQRLAAMKEHKGYAATIEKPPTSVLAQRAGLVSLGLTQTLLGTAPSQGIGGFVRRDWAREHSELLERYIAAFIESQRWLLAPANKQQVVELLAKDARLPPDIAADTYDVDAKSAWTPDARFQPDGFQQVLNLRAAAGDSKPMAGRPANAYYDLSYYDEALALVNSHSQ